jgi:hypothetical protein
VVGARNLKGAGGEAQAQTQAFAFVREQARGVLPVVVMDHHTFTRLSHYAPGGRAAPRLPGDRRASLRHLGHNSVDQGMLDLDGLLGFNVREYAPFVSAGRAFYVYGSSTSELLLSELAEAGVPLAEGAERRQSALSEPAPPAVTDHEKGDSGNDARGSNRGRDRGLVAPMIEPGRREVTLFERAVAGWAALQARFPIGKDQEIERYYHFICKGDTATSG